MLSLMVLFVAINFFIAAPLLFMGLSDLFSDNTFSYKKSLILCLQLALIALLVQALQVTISVYLSSLSILLNFMLSLAFLAITTYIIKVKFDTTILKAILVQVINIVFTLIITLSFKHFACQAYKIPAGSNIPTLLVGDHILVNKYIYRFDSPERYDVVVFKFPQDERLDYVKRIVALPQEEVKIVNKKLFVNGKPVDEDYALFIDDNILTSNKGALRDNFGPVTVPDDSYFMLGDNRDNSYDSRFWGFVNKDNIKGKADVIYFSYDKDAKAVRSDRIGIKIQ